MTKGFIATNKRVKESPASASSAANNKKASSAANTGDVTKLDLIIGIAVVGFVFTCVGATQTLRRNKREK